MEKIISMINRISEISGKILTLLIIPMIAVVVYTAILRYVPGWKSPSWGFEISLFFYGIHAILSGAYVLHVKEHVRLDIITEMLTWKWKMYFDVLSNLVIMIICFIFIWKGSMWAWESTKILEHSIHQTAFNPPIWWYKWTIPISALLIFIQAFADLIMVIKLAKRREE